MHHHMHTHDSLLVGLSIVIAMFASYTALNLANSVTVARGKVRLAWLLGGSIAMGVGIWSMHFVAMLAFQLPGIPIAYDIFLMLLSVLVAIAASALALFIVSRERVTTAAYISGSIAMGGAIAGMHYIGIASMRMAARWRWDYSLVGVSIAIAIVASFAALQLSFRLRNNLSRRGLWYRAAAGMLMGLAIAGMHYTAMMAMTFEAYEPVPLSQDYLLATSGLAVAVIGTTVLILAIALAGTVVDRALARQQANIRTRDEFLSVASHELKTPLTSLKLQTQMRQRTLAKGGYATVTPEKLKSMFDTDARQIERLTRLIDDMLDISRINSGRLAMNQESFDLRELAKEVVERHEPQFENAGCKIQLKADGPVLGFWDRFRIEQVLTNLLTNAMKYGAGKPVQVELAREGHDKVRLKVTDQGIGVAEENHERIFQRFERAVSASEISGLGLGLYIVREIIEMHRGRITIQSALGKGATFTVELPIGDQDVG